MNPFSRSGRAESRLRNRVLETKHVEAGHGVSTDPEVLRWAVDEIDRLRTDVERLRKANVYMSICLENARSSVIAAEIELRKTVDSGEVSKSSQEKP